MTSQLGQDRRKRNLVIFLPDQQRADTIKSYGGRVHTPNLDQLAAQSAVFQQAYVTQPICTPSRSSLMTGTWPHANGCTRNFLILDPHWRCLPELIADADYRFGYVGKWHLGNEMFAQHGFEEWVSVENDPRYQNWLAQVATPPLSANTVNFFSREDCNLATAEIISIIGLPPTFRSSCRSRSSSKAKPASFWTIIRTSHSCCLWLSSSRTRLTTAL